MEMSAYSRKIDRMYKPALTSDNPIKGLAVFLFSEGEKPASEEDLNTSAERMLKSYGDSILRLSYSYLHSMEDAEDIVQETLIKFLQKAPPLSGAVSEKAWLLRVAANLSKNRIKYNKLRVADELNDELVKEEREDLSFVWEAVKSLPVRYREALHLFYYEGCSTREIAKILKTSETTVRTNLSRGRKKLRSVLKEEYDLEQSL